MVETFNCSEIDKNNLIKGSKGALVTLLQTHLKALGYYTTYNGHYLKIDGDFGDYTAWALKRFQGATGHSKDGEFGIKTCKTLNEKILELNGIKTAPADTTTTTTTTTAKGTTATTTQADPYKIDTSKNIYKVYESNFHVEGLNFIMSSITFDNAFRVGTWKQLELSDGTFYSYKGADQPRAYTVIIYLTNQDYINLRRELYKLQAKPCGVSCEEIDSGKYTVNISVESVKKTHKKLTFKLIEYK